MPSTGQSSRHKAAQVSIKKTLTTSEQLEKLFNSLCAQIDGGHFTNALKTCDKILRVDPTDKDALQTKLFLLLQTEGYEAALEFISSGQEASRYAFERAYSLYRLHMESEAREILDSLKALGGGNRGCLHLEAQLDYRSGDYKVAFDLYNQLLNSVDPQSEEHTDIVTNLQASQRRLDFVNVDFLRSLDRLPVAVSSTLETSPPPSQPAPSLAAALASARTEAPVIKAKKVRMSRVPKGVVPGVNVPDPERWLKKSERSTYGQGKRRKGPAGGGATQGSVESAAASAPVKSSKTAVKNKGKKK